MFEIIKKAIGNVHLTEKISEQIVMFSSDAIITLDEEMGILMFNEQAEKIFSYHKEEVIGQPLSLLVPEHLRQDQQRILEVLTKDKSIHKDVSDHDFTFIGLKKSGHEFQANAHMLPYRQGGRNLAVLVIKDIASERRNDEEVLRLISTDALTGVYNRQRFISLAEAEARRSKRYNRPLSLLLLDIDRFQDFNNAHGHMTGDKMLQRISTICYNMLRNVDLFGRWSGGEFIAILPETKAEQAKIIAERLRKTIGESEIGENADRLKCTISIGISEFKKSETGIDSAVARAAAAVRHAKQNGRNQVFRFKDISQ